MPIFNNLVVFDPSVAQSSDKSILPDLAESWSWNDDGTELTCGIEPPSLALSRGALAAS